MGGSRTSMLEFAWKDGERRRGEKGREILAEGMREYWGLYLTKYVLLDISENLDSIRDSTSWIVARSVLDTLDLHPLST